MLIKIIIKIKIIIFLAPARISCSYLDSIMKRKNAKIKQNDHITTKTAYLKQRKSLSVYLANTIN